MKYALLFFVIVIRTTLHAQSDVHELQYKAYLSNDPSFSLWKEAIAICQQSLDKKPTSDSLRYELALAQFGLMNATLRTMDEDTFDDYYSKTMKIIVELTERNTKWAEPFALQSAAYGTRLGYNAMLGMVLGSKSNLLIAKAKKLDPRSPFVWKVYANSKFFTPEMFGGDLDEAIEAYQRCIQLYETSAALTKNNWYYLDALAFMGQAYLKKENKADAVLTFEKALKIEPEFKWVKNVLLPKAKALKQP